MFLSQIIKREKQNKVDIQETVLNHSFTGYCFPVITGKVLFYYLLFDMSHLKCQNLKNTYSIIFIISCYLNFYFQVQCWGALPERIEFLSAKSFFIYLMKRRCMESRYLNAQPSFFILQTQLRCSHNSRTCLSHRKEYICFYAALYPSLPL